MNPGQRAIIFQGRGGRADPIAHRCETRSQAVAEVPQVDRLGLLTFDCLIFTACSKLDPYESGL